MINSIQEEITKVNENIDILPKKTKANRAKLVGYIDDKIAKYNTLLESVNKEIDKRYKNITKVEVDPRLEKLESNVIDYVYIKSIDKDLNSYFKLDLDYLLYKLDHFYQDDLDCTNDLIMEVINKFKSININLTNKDFTYTSYVYIYMDNLLNKKNVNKVFNDIYWECPEVFHQLSLSFKHIFYKYKSRIDKYYSKFAKGKDLSLEEDKYNIIYDDIKKIKHTDKGYLLNQFVTKNLLINDFNEASINKNKSILFMEIDNKDNYKNLLSLDESLYDYKTYLDYKFIFDDLKKLYVDKNTYKNVFSGQLKTISKLEDKLSKLNKSLNKGGLFKLKEDKKEEVKLNINNCINDLVNAYNELDLLYIKDTIYNSIGDETSLLDLLRLSSEDFMYMHELFKQRDEEITPEEVINNIIEFKNKLYEKDNSLLENIKVGMDKNIPRIIADRYKLCNFNITEESLDIDNIDNLINITKILITDYDLALVGLDKEDIEFVIDVNKLK